METLQKTYTRLETLLGELYKEGRINLGESSAIWFAFEVLQEQNQEKIIEAIGTCGAEGVSSLSKTE